MGWVSFPATRIPPKAKSQRVHRRSTMANGPECFRTWLRWNRWCSPPLGHEWSPNRDSCRRGWSRRNRSSSSRPRRTGPASLVRQSSVRKSAEVVMGTPLLTFAFKTILPRDSPGANPAPTRGQVRALTRWRASSSCLHWFREQSRTVLTGEQFVMNRQPLPYQAVAILLRRGGIALPPATSRGRLAA
jgi:hypothetical protein